MRKQASLSAVYMALVKLSTKISRIILTQNDRPCLGIPFLKYIQVTLTVMLIIMFLQFIVKMNMCNKILLKQFIVPHSFLFFCQDFHRMF